MRSALLGFLLLWASALLFLLPLGSRAQCIILSETFDSSSLDPRISFTTNVSTHAPGASYQAVFGSNAFGFGRSSCGSCPCTGSCFAYVTDLRIVFSQPVFVDSLSFSEAELFSNCGGTGQIFIDGVDLTSPAIAFAKFPRNQCFPDVTPRLHTYAVMQCVSVIDFHVSDITSQSESFIDDIKIFGKCAVTNAADTLVSRTCDSSFGYVTLRNTTGCGPLTLDSLRVALPFFLDSASMPITIATDDSTVVRIDFKPDSIGSFSDTLHAHAHTGTSGFAIGFPLVGIGLRGYPAILASTDTLDFGIVPVCQKRTDTLFVMSTGCDTVLLTDTLSDVSYGLSLSKNQPSRLPPGAIDTLIVTITPTPQSGGVHRARLLLHYQRGDSIVTILTTIIAPSVLISRSGRLVLCRDSSVVLTASPQGASYQWYRDGMVLTGDTIPVELADQEGMYEVVLTDSNGCLAKDSALVMADPLFAHIGPRGVQYICPDSVLSVLAYPTAGYPLYKYVWNRNGAVLAGDTIWLLNVADSGMYTVTVTDTFGCSSTSEPLFLSIAPRPVVTVTPAGPLSICKGDSLPLYASPGFAHYYWSTGSTVDSTWSSKPGWYWVYSVSDSGCKSDTAFVTLSNFPVPHSIIQRSTPHPFCEGDSVILRLPDTLESYLWSDSSTAASLFVSKTGFYFARLTDRLGCVGYSDTVHVIVNPRPVAKLQDSMVVHCQGDPVTLIAIDSAPRHLWGPGVGSQNSDSIRVTSPGTYWIVAVSDSGCSSDTVRASVRFLPLPTPRVLLGDSSVAPDSVFICQGDNLSLMTEAGDSTYRWNNASTGRTIVVDSSGPYFVIVQDSAGCFGTSDTVRVIVRRKPVISIDSSGSLTICAGRSVTLSAPPGDARYHWFVHDSALSNPDSSLLVTTGGRYSVYADSGNGCSSDTASVFVQVIPLPRILGPVAICGDSNVVYSLSGLVPTDSVAWAIHGFGTIGGLSNGDSLKVHWIPGGFHSLSAIAIDTLHHCDCFDTLTVTIDSLPSLRLTPISPIPLCSNIPAPLHASGRGLRYQWFRDSVQISLSPNPDIIVDLPGTYSVTGIDSLGCYGHSDSVICFQQGSLYLAWPVVSPASALAGDTVNVKLFMGNTNPVLQIRRLKVVMQFNHDMLTYSSLDSACGMVDTASLSDSTIELTVSFPNPLHLDSAISCILANLKCNVFLTAAMSATISLHNLQLDVGEGWVSIDSCAVGSALLSLRDTCGTGLLLELLRTGTFVTIIEARPNPTKSEMTVTLDVPAGYQNDGHLEVYDALGTILATYPLVFSDQQARIDLAISLTGASGPRYLRAVSKAGVSTRRVEVQR